MKGGYTHLEAKLTETKECTADLKKQDLTTTVLSSHFTFLNFSFFHS